MSSYSQQSTDEGGRINSIRARLSDHHSVRQLHANQEPPPATDIHHEYRSSALPTCHSVTAIFHRFFPCRERDCERNRAL